MTRGRHPKSRIQPGVLRGAKGRRRGRVVVAGGDALEPLVTDVEDVAVVAVQLARVGGQGMGPHVEEGRGGGVVDLANGATRTGTGLRRCRTQGRGKR